MATKQLNVRVSLRYDTYENWLAANPVLMRGEMAIATVPVGAGAVQNEPAVLIKTGDGSTAYADLPFVSALAADVLTACKTTEGLTKFVEKVLVDSGILSDSEAGEAAKSLAERVTEAETAIKALEKADEDIRAEIAAKISSTYKASGSVASAADLPAPDATTLGNVYHVSTDFETTAQFIEGAGKKVPAGSNVVIVETKAAVPGTPAEGENPEVPGTPAEYGYDVVGSFINLSDYYTKEQTEALIPEAVKEALTPTTNPDNPEAPAEKSPLLEKVEEVIAGAIDKLDVADEGEGFVTSVTQTDGLIAVVKKAIETKDVTGLEKEIQTVIKESLTAPAAPVDPENPTPEETAAQELYDTIMKEVEKLINEALAGKNGEAGADGTLETTIKKIVEEAIKDAGKPAEGENPEEPASALNEAVKTVVTGELDKLDYTNDAEGVVTSVSQENGLIAVVKKVLAAADISDFTKVVKETIASAVKEPTQVEDPDNPGSMLPVNPTDEATYDAIVDAVVKIVMDELGKKTVTGEGGTGTEEVPVNEVFYNKIRDIVAEMVAEAIVNGKDGADGKDGVTTTIIQSVVDELKDAGKPAVPGENEGDPETPAVPASELNTTVNNMIDAKIDEINVTDTEVENEVVVAVSQTSGKIAITRKKMTLADLSNPEDSADSIVLDCGGAGA